VGLPGEQVSHALDGNDDRSRSLDDAERPSDDEQEA